MKKELLKKILYFIIPNLLFITFFSYFYNEAFNPNGDSFEIMYREVIIMSFIYFLIFSIVHFILRFKLDVDKVFFIKIVLILLSFEMIYSSWIIIILVCSILSILFIPSSIRNKLIFVFSYFIVILFLFNFPQATLNSLSQIKRFNNSKYEKKIELANENESPNIYWIHCDAMINFDDANDYFDFDSEYIKSYLNEEDFFVNDSAYLKSSRHTTQALVALFNPYYYDEFFYKYLEKIYNYDVNSSIVSHDVLLDKKLNNELFDSFKKKGYKFATITDFNQYASFYTDYMFDYYTYQKSDSKKLKFFTSSDNSESDVRKYIKFAHLKTLSDTTFLHFFTDDWNFLKHKELDYNEYDFSNYEYLSKTEYWKAKAIVKSLDTVYDTNPEKLFTFIDYSINHTPWLYDKEGRKVNTNLEGFYPSSFIENYEYSTYLLVDLIKFIKEKDESSIIILQSDHGFHTVDPLNMARAYGKDISGSEKLGDSTISAIYIPEKYRNGEEKYLAEPLNISRYLINNYIGVNYDYLEVEDKS